MGCVRELGAPHYGHQIIKSLIYKAVESGEEQVRRSRGLDTSVKSALHPCIHRLDTVYAFIKTPV